MKPRNKHVIVVGGSCHGGVNRAMYRGIYGKRPGLEPGYVADSSYAKKRSSGIWRGYIDERV